MSKIVVAIVISTGRVLMARRRQSEGTLHWQFPAGALRSGESDFAAAERETFEETNIHCRGTRTLGQRTHPNTGREVVYVLCDYVSGVPEVRDAEELDQVGWMKPDEVFQAVTSDIFPPVRQFLETVKE